MTKTAEQVRRAYELLDFLHEHPEHHDQDFWIDRGPNRLAFPAGAARVLNTCGTTACAAGWTALLNGYEFVSFDYVSLPDLPDADVEPAPEVAADLLGLTGAEAIQLFHESADLAEVTDAIHEIFGPRPVAA